MGGSAVALAIKVSADARSASAELDHATQTTSKLGQAGKVAGRLLAAGLLLAVGAAVKFTQAAAEDAEAQAKLAQTAQQAAGATSEQVAAMEDWIAAQGRAKGVADDELRPAMSKLITVTKDIGEAQRLSSLAMDISARTGKSLESVTQSLVRAQTGSASTLGKYGVQTKDATGKTRDLAAVQADLAKLYSGAAATAAGTAAGKQKILKVQMDELQESIGQRLLPVMLKLTSAGLAVVDWITKNQTAALAIIATLGGLLAIVKAVSVAQQAWAAVSAVVSVAQGVFAAATGAGTVALGTNATALAAHAAASKVAAAGQWALNAAMSANPIALVVIAVAALVAAIILAYKHSETFRRIVDAAFRAVQAAAEFAFNWVRDHWKLLLAILTGPFGIAVGQIITHRDKIVDAIRTAIAWVRDHWEAILVILTGPVGLAVVAIIKHRDQIVDAVRGAIDWVRDHWRDVGDIMTAPFRFAVDQIKEKKDRIVEIVDAARDRVVDGFKAMWAPIQTMIDMVQRLIDLIASIDFPDLPDIPGLGRVLSRTTSPAPSITSSSSSDQAIKDQTRELGALTLDQSEVLRALTDEVRGLRTEHKNAPSDTARELRHMLRAVGARF